MKAKEYVDIYNEIKQGMNSPTESITRLFNKFMSQAKAVNAITGQRLLLSVSGVRAEEKHWQAIARAVYAQDESLRRAMELSALENIYKDMIARGWPELYKAAFIQLAHQGAQQGNRFAKSLHPSYR